MEQETVFIVGIQIGGIKREDILILFITDRFQKEEKIDLLSVKTRVKNSIVGIEDNFKPCASRWKKVSAVLFSVDVLRREVKPWRNYYLIDHNSFCSIYYERSTICHVGNVAKEHFFFLHFTAFHVGKASRCVYWNTVS